MNESTKTQVRQRAEFHCEYCRLNQVDSPLTPLHVEHIRPIKHGGSHELNNLALACINCNLHKGTNLTGIDPESDEIAVLYHPRRDVWSEHFEFNGIYVIGLTPTGRATVEVLDFNSDDRLAIRSS